MANEAAVTQTINIVPVQGIFQPEPTFALVTLIGPAGTPFYANINPYQSGLHITDSTIDSSPIGSITPSTGVFTNVDLTTGTITSVPTGPTSIVNQAYVDAVAQGLSFKQPANYVTTGNITLSGLAVQAGGDWPTTLTAGDRILVKDQSTAANNGIYVAAAGAWSRASDANTYSEYLGAYLFILSGTLYAGSAWVCTNQPGGTLGVTAITFTQFSNNALYTAGTGLTLTGYQFSITDIGTAGTYGSASQVPVFVTNAQGQVTSVTNTSISIAGSQITSGTIDSARLSGSYTGITGVGTLTAGTWNASTIGVAYGGTGVATLTAGYVKADGTNPFSTVATIPNTDITGLGTMSTQNANNVAITGGSVAVGTLKTLGLTGYLYGNDTGAVTASTTIPNTAITGLGTMSTQNANAVAITGGTITGLTQLGTDYLQFNTGATVTPAVGKIWWDGGTTMNIGMTTAVTQHVGEDLYYYIKASAAITKGQVVMFTGSVGASGVITGAPATGVTDGSYIMGIAAEDMANNAFGLVQEFGILRNVNTSGYADGDILWYDPTVTGGLTKTKPVAPNIKVQMAAVVNGGSAGGGAIQVRVSPGSVLGGTDSNVQFGTLAANDLIQYNGTYWTNITPAALTGVGTALNLSGGGAGQIPYQSGASTTAFLAAGTSGQVLTSNGTSAPSWTTPTAYATITDDTTTNATRYPLFANQTTGNITTEYVSSTKLQFNPSTGVFTSTSFSGAGTGLTGTASGLSIGGNAATATSATSATTATNLAGGANGSLPYQTGSGATTFLAASTNGYILTLAGGVPTWAAAPLTGITISDDTTTNATRYLTFTSATTGNITSENVSSTKLQFNPSTGALTPTSITPTNAVGIAYGGTGQTTQTAAFDALAPSTTKGDLIVDNGTNNVRLPVGTNGQVLTADSTQANGVKWASAAGGVAWQAVQTASFTAAAASAYPINTTSASITATLPASPAAGDQITFVDYAGTFATNPLTVNANGNKINSTTTLRQLKNNREAVTFVYVDSTQGWIVANDGYLGTVPFVNAVFDVDYLVIAGGGGGARGYGVGGGGAGGYRTATGFSVTAATTYTVTVGGGGNGGTGSGGPVSGSSGSNSVFSTITSAGGGAGSSGTGVAGGSGGGGAPNNNAAGGAGNTPSTSPSQGNSGGNAQPNAATSHGGGGGGGAGAAGSNGPGTGQGGNGGAGTASSITGSSVTRAGGGGGSGETVSSGSGGSGGGGNAGFNAAGSNGTANTGGGGGAGGGGSVYNGGNGGSGVVIIKYPDTYTISNPGGGLTYSTATSGGFSVTTFTAGTGNVSWN